MLDNSYTNYYHKIVDKITSSKGFFIGLSLVLAGALVAIVILNYFNILHLNFLPGQNTTTKDNPESKTAAKIPCPLKKSPCPKGVEITASTAIPEFKGLGFSGENMKGIEVVAVTSGVYALLQTPFERSKKPKTRISVVIVNGEDDLLVEYIFPGTLPKDFPAEGTIETNQTLGFLTDVAIGKGIFGEKNYNLIFSVQGLKDRQYKKLNLSSDGVNY